ncbi:hypothetical protein GCM10010345_62800 [Streptomyces canarius]|uniref:Uncharacterized protein n=1 Tax=Streptomyces canarius TaxID=285453 RepID=A0ABQ3D3M3_9ACTN|nr:hypothetical protein GCM10010345_62800 [Streptomyces canarius]
MRHTRELTPADHADYRERHTPSVSATRRLPDRVPLTDSYPVLPRLFPTCFHGVARSTGTGDPARLAWRG